MFTVPAAAVTRGSTVVLDGTELRVDRVDNSTPRPGLITWTLHTGAPITIGAAHDVDVSRLILPKAAMP